MGNINIDDDKDGLGAWPTLLGISNFGVPVFEGYPQHSQRATAPNRDGRRVILNQTE